MAAVYGPLVKTPTKTTYHAPTQAHPPKKIQASPYEDVLLPLNGLDRKYSELAQRLSQMQPTLAEFLNLDYADAFNFKSCLRGHRGSVTLYVVVFRSTIAKDAVSTKLFDDLHRQDHASYAEAMSQVGGLLKYWFGSIDTERRNLATCIWTDQEHARTASRLPQHQKAIELVKSGVYERWAVERFLFHIENDSFHFESL